MGLSEFMHQGGNEGKAVVGVGDNYKEGGLPVADCIKFHFIITHQVSDFLDIEGCEPRAARYEDRFSGLAGRQFILGILPDGEMLRLWRRFPYGAAFIIENDITVFIKKRFAVLKIFKEIIYRVFIRFIFFTDFHRINRFNEGVHIFFFVGRFVMDVSDEGAI